MFGIGFLRRQGEISLIQGHPFGCVCVTQLGPIEKKRCNLNGKFIGFYEVDTPKRSAVTLANLTQS